VGRQTSAGRSTNMAGFDGFDSVGFANAPSAAIASDSDTSVWAKVGIGWDAVRRRRLDRPPHPAAGFAWREQRVARAALPTAQPCAECRFCLDAALLPAAIRPRSR
jgi:hypothetical protein